MWRSISYIALFVHGLLFYIFLSWTHGSFSSLVPTLFEAWAIDWTGMVFLLDRFRLEHLRHGYGFGSFEALFVPRRVLGMGGGLSVWAVECLLALLSKDSLRMPLMLAVFASNHFKIGDWAVLAMDCASLPAMQPAVEASGKWDRVLRPSPVSRWLVEEDNPGIHHIRPRQHSWFALSTAKPIHPFHASISSPPSLLSR